MNIIKSLFLGIIEGITEWIPVSSFVHIKLFSIFIHIDVYDDFYEIWKISMQLGAIIALIIVFYNKISIFGSSKKPLGRGKLSYVKKDKLSVWAKILIAYLPIILFELLIGDSLSFINSANEMSFMAGALIVMGLFIIGVEIYIVNKKPLYLTSKEIPYVDALIIGCSQIVAITFPGMSKIGTVIITALLLSISRLAAIEFAFELAIPIVLGNVISKLIGYGLLFSFEEILIIVFSMISAFAISLYMIRFVIEYVKKNKFYMFGIYGIVLGLIIIIYL